MPDHFKICASTHNEQGLVSTLMQLDKKSVPIRFDFDLKKIFHKEDAHWNDFYIYKERNTDSDYMAFDHNKII